MCCLASSRAMFAGGQNQSTPIVGADGALLVVVCPHLRVIYWINIGILSASTSPTLTERIDEGGDAANSEDP